SHPCNPPALRPPSVASAKRGSLVEGRWSTRTRFWTSFGLSKTTLIRCATASYNSPLSQVLNYPPHLGAKAYPHKTSRQIFDILVEGVKAAASQNGAPTAAQRGGGAAPEPRAKQGAKGKTDLNGVNRR